MSPENFAKRCVPSNFGGANDSILLARVNLKIIAWEPSGVFETVGDRQRAKHYTLINTGGIDIFNNLIQCTKIQL